MSGTRIKYLLFQSQQKHRLTSQPAPEMGVGLLHVANVYAEAQASALVWVPNKVNLL